MYEQLIKRLKHLPGKHDQSSHGRGGSRGGGSSYSPISAEPTSTQSKADRLRELRAKSDADNINALAVYRTAIRDGEGKLSDEEKKALGDELKKAQLKRSEEMNEIVKLMKEIKEEEAKNAPEEVKNVPEKVKKPREPKQVEPQPDPLAPKTLRDKSVDEIANEFERLLIGASKNTQLVVNAYVSFFEQMKHPNPPIVKIKHVGGTKEQRKQAQQLAEGIVKMFPMKTNPKGEPIPIRFTFTHDNITRSFAQKNGKLTINDNPSVIVHEVFHEMQKQYNYSPMNKITEKWAIKRIGNEKPINLHDDIGTQYNENEVGYRDRVDSPYVLKDYKSPNNFRFREVLPEAFTHDFNGNLELANRKDKELLRIGIEAVLSVKERK